MTSAKTARESKPSAGNGALFARVSRYAADRMPGHAPPAQATVVESDKEAQRFRGAGVAILACMVASGCNTLFAFAIGAERLAWVHLIYFVLQLPLLALLQKHVIGLPALVHLAAATLAAGAMALVLMTGGVTSSINVMFFGPFLLAAILLNLRAALIWTFICAGLAVTVYLLQDRSDAWYAIPSGKEAMVYAYYLWISLAIMGLAVMIYDRSLRYVEQQIAQKNELLGQTRDELIEAQNAREDFYASVNHELLTPVNAINAICNLLDGDESESDAHTRRDLMNALKRSNRHLMHLVRDVLDYTKTQHGGMSFDQVPFDLPALLDDIVQMSRLAADEKGLQMRKQVDDALPRYVIGDEGRTAQIVYNLINNALKFTQKGHVTLRCLCGRERRTGQVEIIFEVEDTGIGIPREMQRKVFERFAQIDGSGRKGYSGVGIGLHMVKSLTEMQGGQVSIDSIEGEGTTFRVVIPMDVSDGVDSASPPPQLATPIRLLLVDDSNVNRMVTATALKRQCPAITIDEAADGLVAIERTREHNYDLILMDVRMPNMDGVEATRQIRRQFPSRSDKLTIIALTADQSHADRERYLKAGMDDLLSKPIDLELLLKRIATVAKRKADGMKSREQT